MDQTERKRRKNLFLLSLTLILAALLMTWMWYDAWIVRRDPLYLFTAGYRHDFFYVLAFFFLVLVMFYATYARKIPYNPPAENTDTLTGRNDPSPGNVSRQPFSIIPSGIFNGFVVGVLIIYLIGSSYAILRSVPFTLAITGEIIVTCGVVGILMSRMDKASRESWGFILSIIIMAVVSVTILVAGIIPYQLTGSCLFSPDFSFDLFVSQASKNIPLLILLTGSLILIAIVTWCFFRGTPLLRPLTDTDLQEQYEEEVVLSVPFDQAFGLCRDSIRFLPNSRINTADPVFGTLSASATPGWGRLSSVYFIVEKITEEKSRVKISSISPVPSGENEPRKRTGINRKYVKILVAYLRSQ